MGTNSKRKVIARKMMKQPETEFKPIDLNTGGFIPTGMTRAFSNNRYTVMIYDNTPVSTGKAIKVMVQKHDNTPIIRHWMELQRIKNRIFGNDVTAIEYFPAETDLIDDYNIYWLWVFPEGDLPMPIM